jgi:hypothetical protein
LNNDAIATEVRGLELVFDGHNLVLRSNDAELISPCALGTEDAERLRVELAKSQLWEWNRFEELKSRAELRYRRYLGALLVMCLAAFSAYIGYPGYALPIVFSLLSLFLWWRAGYEEQRSEREAQAQRSEFRAEWEYVRQRLEDAGVDL